MCMQRERGREIIDSLTSRWVYWCTRIKNPLNSAIANNEPSLPKAQQAPIGFKVMKKTTRSIIIKAWCRHVRAQAVCCDLQGRAPSIGARTGPSPWGNHPSTTINVVKAAAAPEVFPLIEKRCHDGLSVIKLQLHQPGDETDVFIKR